jgi:hypothetical protein
MNRGVKSAILVIVGVGLGFPARRLLDELMAAYPTWATQIDTIGQFLYALLVVWFCLLPMFRMYGVIPDRKSTEV